MNCLAELGALLINVSQRVLERARIARVSASNIASEFPICRHVPALAVPSREKVTPASSRCK